MNRISIYQYVKYNDKNTDTDKWREIGITVSCKMREYSIASLSNATFSEQHLSNCNIYSQTCRLTVRHYGLLTTLQYCAFTLTNVDCLSLIWVTSDSVRWSCIRNVIAPP